jgi:hypothetical protein
MFYSVEYALSLMLKHYDRSVEEMYFQPTGTGAGTGTEKRK